MLKTECHITMYVKKKMYSWVASNLKMATAVEKYLNSRQKGNLVNFLFTSILQLNVLKNADIS